jgi:hypothetical protein
MSARTVEQFCARLRRLKVWAGSPSFEELRRRCGQPSSTLADALSARRTRLPRLDVVRDYVRACGGTAGDVARWEQGWRAVQDRQEGMGTATAPPTRACERAHQLPRDVTHFVGREDVLGHLTALRRHPSDPDRPSALALLVGAAGVGKTALAVHWGLRAASGYPDGQLFVDLCGLSAQRALTAKRAILILLNGLGISGEELPEQLNAQAALYRSLTYDRRLLIVLDNARDAAQVRPLLPAGQRCYTIVTSRDRLSGLVAREDGWRHTLAPLRPREAAALVELILGDGRAVREPVATRELARLCGHLPMALRIVAANLVDRPRLSISEFVAHLTAGDRLAQLAVAGDRTSAVQSAFDTSYVALDTATRRLFRRLSTLSEPAFTVAEAALLDAAAPAQTRRRLEKLADAHLIEPLGADQYAIDDLVHLYAEALARRQHDTERTSSAVGTHQTQRRITTRRRRSASPTGDRHAGAAA